MEEDGAAVVSTFPFCSHQPLSAEGRVGGRELPIRGKTNEGIETSLIKGRGHWGRAQGKRQ